MMERAHGKVVFEIRSLLKPSGAELLQMLEPPATDIMAADHPQHTDKLHDFFGESVDPETSMLFDIVRTGHVVVKHTLSSGGKQLMKVWDNARSHHYLFC